MLTLVTLSASAEFWGGLSISSGRNYFSSALKESLQVNPIYKDTFMVNMPGKFSAYNAMAAITLGSLLNIDTDSIKDYLEAFVRELRNVGVTFTPSELLAVA